MKLTDAEWRERLTPEQYKVLRQKGTEEPFSGAYVKVRKDGIYTCAACGAKLFDAKTQFDGDCGWPSFYNVLTTDAVRLAEDNSLGMQRIEVSCANCGGHLGHVFNDAPDQPTGMRFCINSVSLDYKPVNKEK